MIPRVTKLWCVEKKVKFLHPSQVCKKGHFSSAATYTSGRSIEKIQLFDR
jgi:hypothetical protein